MLNLRKVAVTGGLSCGKSSVCRSFEKLGAYVVNADDIVHVLLTPETNLGQNVIRLIGKDIIVNNQIDRSKISQKVFNQPSLLNSLEHILHPAVQEEIKKQYEIANQQKKGTLFVAEIPLLYEAGMEDFYDAVITVTADPQLTLSRFQERTGKGKEEYTKRMQRQLPLDDKVKRADYVIYNNGTLKDLENETKKLMNILTHKI